MKGDVAEVSEAVDALFCWIKECNQKVGGWRGCVLV